MVELANGYQTILTTSVNVNQGILESTVKKINVHALNLTLV